MDRTHVQPPTDNEGNALPEPEPYTGTNALLVEFLVSYPKHLQKRWSHRHSVAKKRHFCSKLDDLATSFHPDDLATVNLEVDAEMGVSNLVTDRVSLMESSKYVSKLEDLLDRKIQKLLDHHCLIVAGLIMQQTPDRAASSSKTFFRKLNGMLKTMNSRAEESAKRECAIVEYEEISF